MQETVRLSKEIGCGIKLARDLLALAGGDYDLVIAASKTATDGVETLKTTIISERVARIETRLDEIEDELDEEYDEE